MAPLRPISRADLVRNLRRLGFEGPYSGGRHQYMARESLTVALPNPHTSDISTGLLVRILSQAGISREEWEKLA